MVRFRSMCGPTRMSSSAENIFRRVGYYRAPIASSERPLADVPSRPSAGRFWPGAAPITPQPSNTNIRRGRISRSPPPLGPNGSPQRIETLAPTRYDSNLAASSTTSPRREVDPIDRDLDQPPTPRAQRRPRIGVPIASTEEPFTEHHAMAWRQLVGFQVRLTCGLSIHSPARPILGTQHAPDLAKPPYYRTNSRPNIHRKPPTPAIAKP
jgi:hypothetical protein